MHASDDTQEEAEQTDRESETAVLCSLDSALLCCSAPVLSCNVSIV